MKLKLIHNDTLLCAMNRLMYPDIERITHILPIEECSPLFFLPKLLTNTLHLLK